MTKKIVLFADGTGNAFARQIEYMAYVRRVGHVEKRNRSPFISKASALLPSGLGRFLMGPLVSARSEYSQTFIASCVGTGSRGTKSICSASAAGPSRSAPS